MKQPFSGHTCHEITWRVYNLRIIRANSQKWYVGTVIEHKQNMFYLCQSKWWDLVSCLTKVPQHHVDERAEREAVEGEGTDKTGRSGGARLGCEPLRRSRPHSSFCRRSSEHSHRLGFERFMSSLRSDSSRRVSGPRYRYVSAADELLLRFTFVDLLQPAYSGVLLRWTVGSLV